MISVRFVTCSALAVAVFGIAGCFGDEPDKILPVQAPERVDSAANFTGERHEVAEVIERFERAVVTDDVQTICGDILAVQENHGYDDDNGGRAFCLEDPASQPESILAESGGADAFDLQVAKIVREGTNPARKRYKAQVLVAGRQQEYVVEKFEGEWAITERDFIGDALTGERRDKECELSSLSVRSSLVPKTNDPSKAVLQGPFGDRVRKALDHRGTFELDHISYRPDYVVSFALRKKDGTFITEFPVRCGGHESSTCTR